MVKKFSTLILLILISCQTAFADTSTDKIVTIPVPKFSQTPITVESQNKQSATSPTATALSTQNTPDNSVVKPVEVLVQPPAFAEDELATTEDKTSVLSVNEEAVKPLSLTPQVVEAGNKPETSKLVGDPAMVSEPEPVPAVSQPYTLDSAGPNSLWRLVYLFSIFFALFVAENRYRVSRKVKKSN